MTNDRLQKAESRLRDLINEPRRRQHLLRDGTQWVQMCAALDAIGDTQLGIRAFLDGEMADLTQGGRYIAMYGVLQALYVQQDATRKIANVLSLPFEPPSDVRNIRDTRNAAIGHPSDYKQSKSAGIVRISLSNSGFELFVFDEDGLQERRTVDMVKMCEAQTDSIACMLEAAILRLEEEERSHRRQYRDRPLSGVFPAYLGHSVEKISEAISDSAAKPFALYGFSTVRKLITDFCDRIAERGINGAYDSIDSAIEELRYALDRIETLVAGGRANLDEREGQARLNYLESRISKLELLANEIDREYASDEI